MAGRQRVLLVDGNNVIHAWPGLLKLLSRPGGRRSGLAHRELERRLTAYQDETGERVVLVFDGRGDAIEQSDPRDRGIQVVRSDSARSADEIIESLTLRYSDRYEIQVATDDRAIENATAAAGASWLSAAGLHDAIERVERLLERRLKKHRRDS